MIRSIDSMVRDIYEFSRKNSRTISSLSVGLFILMIIYIPSAMVLEAFWGISVKWVMVVYILIVILLFISAIRYIENDGTLSDDKANELADVIWKSDFHDDLKKNQKILNDLSETISMNMSQNIDNKNNSLKWFVGFFTALIPLLNQIFTKMNLLDLIFIFSLIVISGIMIIYLRWNEFDVLNLILTKNSFKYTSALREIESLRKFYLRKEIMKEVSELKEQNESKG